MQLFQYRHPIKALKVCKGFSHNLLQARYNYKQMTNVLLGFLLCKQQNTANYVEEFLDYVKRFKQTRDVAETHVGKKLLNGFLKTTQEWKDAHAPRHPDNLDEMTADRQTMSDGAWERWTAYLLLRNCNQSKYSPPRGCGGEGQIPRGAHSHNQQAEQPQV